MASWRQTAHWRNDFTLYRRALAVDASPFSVHYLAAKSRSGHLLAASDATAATLQELRAIGVPKTVDNDLPGTDHCPGYGSAAKFVACALMGDNLDNRALPGVKINVVMGRHAGFLTAAAALARQHSDDQGVRVSQHAHDRRACRRAPLVRLGHC